MKIKLRQSLLLAGGFLFLLDRILKISADSFWSEAKLVSAWFGWMPHYNPGIAFGTQIPLAIIIIASVVFFVALAYLFFKSTDELIKIGLLIIFFGALSNFADRILFDHTVDYFLVAWSMFNLADALIVAGAGICLFFEFAKKKPV